MRLAYQDMSIERKKQEERLKQTDPKKAEQMERLGMGFGGSRSVSRTCHILLGLSQMWTKRLCLFYFYHVTSGLGVK